MSVVDIQNRITNDWEQYNMYLSSSDSFIYLSSNQEEIVYDSGKVSIVFSVGERYFTGESEASYSIPEEGIYIDPFTTLVIETKEIIGLPNNIYGLLTGKGALIFKGLLISSGKINPGFCDKLRIGIYNGTNKKRKILLDQTLCSCVFMNMESTIKLPIQQQRDISKIDVKPKSTFRHISDWTLNNKEFIAIIISILALLISLSTIF